LRAAPVLPGITDGLVDLSDRQWQIAIKRLASIDLLSMTADGIDAHPLIREYFSQQLRARQPDSFKAAHGRIFDHLCATTPHRPDDLEGLQPLYQAVVHGCLADRQQEACDKVYYDRIRRGEAAYSTHELGATGANLSAVAAFFEQPWSRVSGRLLPADQAWLLNAAALNLRALGRLTEALQPMRAALKMLVQREDPKNAARSACNLSELQLSLGILDVAVTDGLHSVQYADQSGDAFMRIVNRTALADALRQRQQPGRAADPGDLEQARRLFEQAEELQKERPPRYPRLYSLQGFQYCDLLLCPVEQAAWRCLRSDVEVPQVTLAHMEVLSAVEKRAFYSLAISTFNNWLLDMGLDQLTLARLAFFRWLLKSDRAQPLVVEHLQPAVDYLRRAGQQDHLPKGLLTAAVVAFLQGDPDRSEQLLSETQLLAERGPMPMVLADVHLHRARLFRDREQLQKASELIRKHHYGRRFVELEDAERAI
jgi:tetratricopeptide (TPR) repeat protein